jgi:hypothetical protein
MSRKNTKFFGVIQGGMMHKVFKIMSTLCCAAISVSTVYAANNPTSFVGPTITGSYAGWSSPTSGYSLLAEAGPNNYRASVTLGTKLDDASRIKFTAEYLWQNIQYNFFTGDLKAWMQQVAAGIDYEYFVGCNKDHSIELGAYGAHAPSRDLGLSVANLNVLTSAGVVPQIFYQERRVAGSNAYGFIGGVNFYLWTGSKFGVNADYDNFVYQREQHPSYDSRGFGATVRMQQLFGQHLRLNLLGALRRPFANYEAGIHWDNVIWNGRWGFGVIGRYTYGRSTLPTTWNTGLDIQYFADCTPVRPKGAYDYKSEASSCFGGGEYVVIPAAGANPVAVRSRPPELGARLPISRVGYYNTTQNRR